MGHSVRVLFLVLAVPAALFGTDLSANEAVGRIAGQFSVSNDGESGYQIPIELPPGIAGIQPQLSISYSSAGGNGLLGVGWALVGLGRIERCGANFAQDGVNYGVTFSSFDRFCLEGQKLRLSAGEYGGDQSEYRNEIENFMQLRARTAGASGFVPSEGPQYFTARTRDALILEYGGTEDARVRAVAGSRTVAREWLLSRVADPQGNEMTYEYLQDELNGSYRPAVIRYTGRPGQSPAYEVRFEYEERPNNGLNRDLCGKRTHETAA